MASIQVNEETFESEVLKSEIPVLVDFWAPWCGPCQMMGPVVEEVSGQADGKFKVCKVNVDENPNLAQQYAVMSIPNFIVFKGGKAVSQAVGAISKDRLIELANA